MKLCPYCGAQYTDDLRVCPVDGQQLEVPFQAPPDLPATKVHCPTCGAADDYAATVELRGSFSWLVFFAGGIFAVLLRNAGRRRKVRCNQCQTLFEIHPPLAKLSLVLFWLLICPTIICLLILLIALLFNAFSH
jgi:hypothetical protein